MDGLAGGNGAIDSVDEQDELLMPMTLPAAADHRSVEHVHRGKQRRCSIAFVVVGHRSGPALLHRQARVGFGERLALALFVDRHKDGVRRRILNRPDQGSPLYDESWGLLEL